MFINLHFVYARATRGKQPLLGIVAMTESFCFFFRFKHRSRFIGRLELSASSTVTRRANDPSASHDKHKINENGGATFPLLARPYHRAGHNPRWTILYYWLGLFAYILQNYRLSIIRDYSIESLF